MKETITEIIYISYEIAIIISNVTTRTWRRETVIVGLLIKNLLGVWIYLVVIILIALFSATVQLLFSYCSATVTKIVVCFMSTFTYTYSHCHWHLIFLCVQFSFVVFPSKIILISGFLSPVSNQSSASPLVTVKKKPRTKNIRFTPIALFQSYDLHVNKQHEPVSLSSRCIRSNTLGSSFRLLHSFVNWFKVQENFTISCLIAYINLRIMFSFFLFSKCT